MLTELKLSNFRIFDDEVAVRFRPITVFIGHNNSGKSSIIKFLLMLQQSLDPGKPQFLTPEGNRVQLGIFSELKNSLTTKKNLHFQLTAKGPSSPSGSFLEYVKSFDGVEVARLLYTIDTAILYGDIQTGHTEYFLVDEKSPDKKLIVRGSDVSDTSTFLSIPPEVYQKIRFGALDATREMQRVLDGLRESISNFVAENEFLDILRHQITAIRHLSAVREDSQRVISASPPPPGDVGQRGQYALPHLQRMTDEIKAQGGFEFILPHIKNVAGIENVRFEKPSQYLSQCLGRNYETGADVPIANYGFGVSQCLPIFIQGAIMPAQTSLMIEQPEAQLHPTAQLEMGSFFCDLWNKRGVGSIIETHSDNILLRLRRLIATGELSAKDVSVAYFTHDKKNRNMPVIWNLNINEDGSVQSRFPEEFLPAEFFGKNLHEVLKIGSASRKQSHK